MSQALFRLPVIAVVIAAAAALGWHLLPLLLALYVLTSGSEAFLSYLTTRWLVDELESRARSADEPDPARVPPLRTLGSMVWQTVSGAVWNAVDLVVIGPRYRYLERHDRFGHQGRHHADRWSRHEIDGTVAQRRPSAAAQQLMVERIVKADTGEQPVIDDTDIRTWLESARIHQGVM